MKPTTSHPRPILLCLLTGLLSIAASQAATFSKGQRIVFLGDSNTYAAHYVSFIDAALRRQSSDLDLEVLNLGLPSETASGLSEPDHPFPRPTVHERLDRVLAKTRPDVVVACYGMNDGIYYPQNDERFRAYKAGIRELVNKAHASGATLFLLTPPPFDPLPQRKQGKLLPKDSEKFAWFSIYEDYDDVLADYSKWLMSLEDERIRKTLDVRTPMVEYIAEKRKTDPGYVMSGDGVHFNQEGHLIIANALLKEWGFRPLEDPNSDFVKKVHRRQTLLRDAWVTHCGHKRPKTRKGLPLKEAQAQADAIEQAF